MLVVLVFLLLSQTVWTDREHKVHNIILYPEKHSWCQTTPIQQIVASPGYEPVTIDNNVCVGACYSYSIPRTQPAEPGELIGPYCDSCQPVETKCYHVTLRADQKNVEGPQTTQKRVQIIMKCSCMSCEKIHKEDCEIADQHTIELPSDLFSNSNQTRDPARSELEVPELLHFKPDKNRVHLNINYDDVTQTNEQRFELNAKLINLLKSIQNEGDDSNISYDKDQLRELLKIIEGSENELSDKNLMEFVNFVNIHNSEDLELDLSRLKEVLTAFERNQYLLERHRDFGLDGGVVQEHMIVDPSKTKNHHHHHHHQLGDEMHANGINGHLIHGPHGSMALAPNIKVEEKLNIDSEVLKPNHDGVVITYENHQKNRQID